MAAFLAEAASYAVCVLLRSEVTFCISFHMGRLSYSNLEISVA